MVFRQSLSNDMRTHRFVPVSQRKQIDVLYPLAGSQAVNYSVVSCINILAHFKSFPTVHTENISAIFREKNEHQDLTTRHTKPLTTERIGFASICISVPFWCCCNYCGSQQSQTQINLIRAPAHKSMR